VSTALGGFTHTSMHIPLTDDLQFSQRVQARAASNRPMTNYFGFLLAVLAHFAFTAFTASAHPGSGIAINSQGEVYFVHTGVGVFKVDREGRMAHYAEPGFHFMIFDGEGRFARQRWPRFPDGEIRTAGTSPKLLLASSFPLAIGPDGALYYPQAGSDREVRVMRVAPAGEPVAFATLPTSMEIGPGGKPSRAQWIHGLAAGRDGTLYYSEQSAVRRIGPDGSVSLVADASTVPDCDPPSGMSGPPHGPLLRGLDVASDGTLYVAASGCSAVLKITPAGAVSVMLRASDAWSPTGVAVAGNDLYVLEFRYIEVKRAEEWLPRVRKVSRDGTVTMVATVNPRPK
jgi:hypothetical protein